MSLWNCVLTPVALDVEWIFKSDTFTLKYFKSFIWNENYWVPVINISNNWLFSSCHFFLTLWSKVLFAESQVLCAKSFLSAKLFDKTTITLSWKCNTFGQKQYYFVFGMKVEYFYCRCKLASRPTLWITLCIFTKL